MFEWIQKIRNSSRETKIFVASILIYGLAIVGTTVFAYVRLDFVRSYETKQQDTSSK